MHPSEIEIITRFAATELVGGLFLGKWARVVPDHFLRVQLTYHCYDELRHSWLWTEFLDKKGIKTEPVHGRNEYFHYMGTTDDLVEFLAFVHVYELRVPFHLDLHAQHSKMDPGLKELMLDISKDEKHHIGWIRKYFEELQKKGDTKVALAIEKAGELENRTYTEYIKQVKNIDEYYKELSETIEKNLPSYEFRWKDFLNQQTNA